MPFIYDPNLDEARNQQAIGGGVQLSGASTVADPSGNATGNGTQPGAQVKSGSHFQNIDRYLGVNPAQDFGNQFLGKVANQVSGVSGQMDQAADQFKNQVTGANQLADTGSLQSALTDPTKADKKQFQTWENQSYQGPNSLSESQDAWNKYWSGVNQAKTNTSLLGNEAGRFALLDQYYAKPSYNFGQKSLDNLLVQQSGLGQQTQALQKQAAGLQAQGKQKAEDLQNFASQRAGEVEANRNMVRSAIGIDDKGNVLTGDQAGAIGKAYGAVDAETEKANADRLAQQQAIQSGLQSGNLTPEQLSALGLTKGQKLFDVNLGNYLTLGGNLSRDQVMTPEERARIQALSDLAGVTDTYASGLPSAAGSAYSFDADRLKSAVNDRQNAYTQAFNAPSMVNEAGHQYSYADLQNFVDNVRRGQASAGRDPNDPSTWQGSYADIARDYMNQINQFNNTYQAGRVL